MSEMDKIVEQINAAEKAGDLPTAFKLYKKAAALGNVVAMAEVASLYFSGKGGEQDYEKGFRWYLKAAEKGYPNAMTVVARLYELGIYGVEPDIHEAMKWYVDAANAGESYARQRLETLFKEG